MASLRFIVFAAALCGAALAERHVRVVGGRDGTIDEAPWLIQLVYDATGHGDWGKDSPVTCGGSIVDATHVITAAHCFPEDLPHSSMADQYIRVLAGATDKFEGGKLYEIKTLDVNPNFLVNGEYNQKYDIAVVTLVNPIEFNDKVKPIEIISKRIEPGTPAVSGGWGNIIASLTEGVFAPALKLADYGVSTKEYCDDYLQYSPGYTDEARKSLVCVQPIGTGGMTCAGDSGAGIWSKKDNKPVLWGVLHGGSTPCNPKSGTSMFVDLADKDIRKYLAECGIRGL